jgi:hypothetical protein
MRMVRSSSSEMLARRQAKTTRAGQFEHAQMLVLTENRRRPPFAASPPATAQGSGPAVRSRPGDRRRRRGKSLRYSICSHAAVIGEPLPQPITCGPTRADLSLDFGHAHRGFGVMTSPSNSGRPRWSAGTVLGRTRSRTACATNTRAHAGFRGATGRRALTTCGARPGPAKIIRCISPGR